MDEMKEFVAESREAAVELAAQHFGVPPEELDLRELDESIAGLSGRVMVLARLKGGTSAPSETERPPRREREWERSREGGEQRSRGPRRDASRDRGRDRGRDRNGGRDRGRDRNGDRDRDRGRGRPQEREARERSPRPEPRELPHLSPTGNFVAGVMQRMGVSEGVEFSEEIGAEQIVISVRGEGVKELLRRDARIGAALTHLAGRAAQPHTEPGTRVRVDLDGAPEEIELEPAEEQLLAEVRDLAGSVAESGEPRETHPLSSRERWLVHNSLREIEGVRSESTGEGSEKRVKILPE
jgi:predicted RNA-binding protein Jag